MGEEASRFDKIRIGAAIIINWFVLGASVYYLFNIFLSEKINNIDYILLCIMIVGNAFLSNWLENENNQIAIYSKLYISTMKHQLPLISTIGVIVITYKLLNAFIVPFDFEIFIKDAVDALKLIISIDTIFLGALGLGYKQDKSNIDFIRGIFMLVSFLFFTISIIYSLNQIVYLPSLLPDKQKINSHTLILPIQSLIFGISVFLSTALSQNNKPKPREIKGNLKTEEPEGHSSL
jgi:hypothetical protein